MSDDVWLGLDVGATKTLALLLDTARTVVGRVKIANSAAHGPRQVVARAIDAGRSLLDGRGTVRGVGVGFAGLVDGDRGVVLSSIMLPGWNAFPLRDEIEAAFCAPTAVENDATAAGIGEYVALGAPPALNMALLTVGTGIGGALFIEGRLYRGRAGIAAEFGNMSIDWHGDVCWCGSRGCLNMLASGSAIANHARRFAADDPASRLLTTEGPLTVEEVHAAAIAGDGAAARAIDLGARALGVGVANLINALNPDRVALAGGVTELGPGYLAAVRGAARERCFAESFDHASIEFAAGGYDVGAFGAACLAQDAGGAAS